MCVIYGLRIGLKHMIYHDISYLHVSLSLFHIIYCQTAQTVGLRMFLFWGGEGPGGPESALASASASNAPQRTHVPHTLPLCQGSPNYFVLYTAFRCIDQNSCVCAPFKSVSDTIHYCYNHCCLMLLAGVQHIPLARIGNAII